MFNLDDLIAEFGNRYQNEGQTMANVHAQLFQVGGLEQYFAPQPEESDYFKGVYASVSEVLQAFSIPFTSKGETTYLPTEQRLGEFKIDTKKTPDRFRNTYMGFVTREAKDPDRSKWGILEWILRTLLIPGANEEFKLKVAYWGWQFSGFAGSPTVNGATFVRQLTSESTPNMANASMDGIRTQIARWAAAGRTTQITVGAWNATPATFVTQIEDMVQESAVNTLRDKCDHLFMSRAMHRKYREGRRAKYNLNYAQVGDLDMIEDTSITVVGVSDMDGSENVWMTPAMNRVKPTKGKDGPMFDLQKIDREVKYLADWKSVLTFHVPEFIVHSEHDTTITAGLITARYTEA